MISFLPKLEVRLDDDVTGRTQLGLIKKAGTFRPFFRSPLLVKYPSSQGSILDIA
jgi:hypothetical protein